MPAKGVTVAIMIDLRQDVALFLAVKNVVLRPAASTSPGSLLEM